MTGLLINNFYPMKLPKALKSENGLLPLFFDTSSAVLIPIRDLETKDEIINFLSKKIEKPQ